jgi:hypothetical protein
MAIEKPDVMATQFGPSWAWAKTGLATSSNAATLNSSFTFIVCSPSPMNRSQEVVPVILLQPGSRWKL